MSGKAKLPGHAFISYVREDAHRVDLLQQALVAAGIQVWRDTVDLQPGADWRRKIRKAITDNTLVFIACFSLKSSGRKLSYQNEELILAIEQLRLRSPDDPWFIPVRFDNCVIPDLDIGGGRTLASIQRIDLFGDEAADNTARLIQSVMRTLGNPGYSAALSAEMQHRPSGTALSGPPDGETRVTKDAFPLVSEASDLDIRVHPTVLRIPYIHRDAEDAEIRGYLRSGHPVLLIGSSMVGKTRMAVTLIREMFATRRIIIPDSKDALTFLASDTAAVQDTVIFLDDINRLIGADGITDSAIKRLAANRNAIIGTIRSMEYDRYQPTDRLRPQEWDVLLTFQRVFLTRDLSEIEQQRLSAAVHDPKVEARILQIGIGEYVGAAQYIVDALRVGPTVSPAGYSLVLAVADCRRAGLSNPVSASLLPKLAAPHLVGPNRNSLADEQTFQAALEWATRNINSTTSILQREELDAYSISDYALDLISARSDPVPESTWAIMIQNGSPSNLLSIGFAAANLQQIQIAEEALRKAANCGDPDIVPRAEFGLGILRENRGDVNGARTAYQIVIDSGHLIAPLAAFYLAHMLSERGDIQGASAAYQSVIETSDDEAAPLAALRLGEMLDEQDAVEGAKSAYQQAIDSDYPSIAAQAAIRLGQLLADQGNVVGAQEAFQLAIDSNDAEYAPFAAVKLGILLGEQGDIEGSREALQLVIESDYEAGPMAAVLLGGLLTEHGDTAGARAAYEKAIDSDHPDAGPQAAASLGQLLAKIGDTEGARAAFQRAIDSGHPEAVPKAAFELGALLDEQGDAERARTAFQQAIDFGDAEHGPRAAFNLGALLNRQGDAEGAREAYQIAIDSGHTSYAPFAATALGILLDQQGDIEGARNAFQQAIDSDHPDFAARAAICLGVLLSEHGEPGGAQAAYRRAINSSNADDASTAAFKLGRLLDELGEKREAQAAYQRAIAIGHAEYAPQAALHLGVLLEKQKNLQGARAAYQRAIASRHHEYAPQAAILLGLLHASQGNVESARTSYQIAIDSGRPTDVSFAAMGLGQLLGDHGDIEGARRAYQLAIESGDEDVSATAERRLNALGRTGPSS